MEKSRSQIQRVSGRPRFANQKRVPSWRRANLAFTTSVQLPERAAYLPHLFHLIMQSSPYHLIHFEVTMSHVGLFAICYHMETGANWLLPSFSTRAYSSTSCQGEWCLHMMAQTQSNPQQWSPSNFRHFVAWLYRLQEGEVLPAWSNLASPPGRQNCRFFPCSVYYANMAYILQSATVV